MQDGRRRFSVETIVLLSVGAVFLTVGAFICVTAYNSGKAPPAPSMATVARVNPPMLPPPLDMSAQPEPALPAPYVYAPEGPPTSIFTAPQQDYAPAPRSRVAVAPSPSPPPRQPAPVFPQKPSSPSVALGPSVPAPKTRPIDLNTAAPAVVALAPAPTPTPGQEKKTDGVELAPKPPALNHFDRFTAVYDLMAHTVFLPDGSRLEAHSGLGPLKDDPAHVVEKDRGATPPHEYELTMRESLFHGVQALRLNPVGGSDAIYGRAGLLAHTYMLGPGGDSNGCVSFKNYDAFLAAFQSGQVKKLVVVTSLSVASR